uniref:Uncharacterized protein n=1 Tax=Cacopsylla melanoneura TaxID=428564 RepID=A0A8D8V2J2_9HEMI
MINISLSGIFRFVKWGYCFFFSVFTRSSTVDVCLLGFSTHLGLFSLLYLSYPLSRSFPPSFHFSFDVFLNLEKSSIWVMLVKNRTDLRNLFLVRFGSCC